MIWEARSPGSRLPMPVMSDTRPCQAEEAAAEGAGRPAQAAKPEEPAAPASEGGEAGAAAAVPGSPGGAAPPDHAAARSSMSARAFLGPTPGRSISTRVPAMRSRGFSASRRKASRSLTWAVSTKRSPPYLWKGMLRREQLQLEGQAVMRSPEQHRLTAERHARLAVLEDALDKELALLVLVFAAHQLGPAAFGPPGPEVLGVTLRGSGDHLVGRVENGLRAAVVLLEGDDGGAGEVRGEVEDVADGRGPEGVDGLGVVPDHREILSSRAKHLEDLGLQDVRVLILVDQNAVEASPDGAGGPAVGQQAVPEKQQVVVVEDALLALAIDIGLEQLSQVVDLVLAPGEMDLDGLLDSLPGVDASAVDVHAGALERETPVALGQAQVGAQDAHEVLRVASIEDGERGIESDASAVKAEQAAWRWRGTCRPTPCPRCEGRGRGPRRRYLRAHSHPCRPPEPGSRPRGAAGCPRPCAPSPRRPAVVNVRSSMRPGSVPPAMR